MTIPILKPHDEVTVFKTGKTYIGTVFGVDQDLFWLLVPDLQEVHRGHLCNVFELHGVKHLNAAEWSHELENMFDANRQFSSDAFYHSGGVRSFV
jgi:hypothetical protein